MRDLHMKYLLIGGGPAASSAVQAIRERDSEGAVMLVGQEINRPYHRPPLSKEYLLGRKARTELFTLDDRWFSEHQVELHTGRRASRLDVERRTVLLDNGLEVSFGQLLIATGAAPKALKIRGAELPNVFYLRNIEDADRLRHALDKARQEGRPHADGRGRALVIGGGLLGVEVAAGLRQAGLAVDLVMSCEHPWHRIAGEAMGRLVVRLLEDHGVSVLTRAGPDRFEGDGRVQRAVLSDGRTLECDFVVPAVGIIRSKDLLRGTPIAAENAILVDEHCRTNVPDIYAAGDCAAIFNPLFERYHVMEHWQDAMASGALAGRNMAGANDSYREASSFSTQVFDLTVHGWGEPKAVERRLVRSTPNVEGFMEIGVDAHGRIAQVLAAGSNPDESTLSQLVRRRTLVAGNEERLKDPGFPLNSLLLGQADG